MEHLGKIIGDNLKRLRAEAGMSLGALAEASGVSKSRLGQIERGEANPSVTTVWQIANALRVEFSALVTSPREGSVVARASNVEPVVADRGRYRAYPLFPFDPAHGFEVYVCELDASGRLTAVPHTEGAWETVVVSAGTLTIRVGDELHTLGPGDAIRFKADGPHEYTNPGAEKVVCDMLITYPRVG